ncbi:uncharacterized protein LOC113872717 isoform X2 [Abrus precatorius]|uniref:Uncharacterized protein LOC113872717 isoform X2 n=1 Tax=Abrus precatorius TaxID=3816 RepID=A0A8B8MEK2_ABRPR|nr:uncharacterized protein LOC113872717 isoform X2 [Abrus precatorius]
MDDTRKLYQSLSNATAEAPILIDKDPRTLWETLFEQLRSTFHQFFSALPRRHHHDPQTLSLPPPHSRLWPIVEDLSLILRCSLLVLTLLPSDQKIFILKCRSVLSILNTFLSLDVNESHGLRFRNFLSDVELELSDSCRPFLCALLEVFADELLRHQSLRRYLMIADSVSPIYEKLFACHSNHCDIASVLEMISIHFILSISNEKAFEDFFSTAFLHCEKDFRFPELSLAPSMVLLLDPVVLSAPKMLQAHIISMVSGAVSSGLSSEILAPDIDCYLMAFQKSVILYSMHVSNLQIDGFCIELKCACDSYPLERGNPTFESYIQQETSNRLNQVLSKLDNLWDSYRCKMSSKAKADLLAEYIAFMKGRQCIFVDSGRDVTISILDCIIRGAFSQDATGDALYNIKGTTSAQDIYLLSSILKLMSVSLLQAIKYLNNSGDSSCLKTMGGASIHGKYDFLISIVDHFQQFKCCLPVQTFLFDAIKSQQSNYGLSKSMLVHFIGLLSLSFSNGLDLLAKGCISVIMALMYLFVFKEGDLVTLGSLRDLLLRSCSSEIPSDKSGEGAEDKRAVYKVAAEFHRIRARNLSHFECGAFSGNHVFNLLSSPRKHHYIGLCSSEGIPSPPITQ